MGCRANPVEWSLEDMLLIRLRVTGQVVVREAAKDYGVSEEEVTEALESLSRLNGEEICYRGTLH